MAEGRRRRSVVCVGRGVNGDGCGVVSGESGGVCPRCSGMLLSHEALREAEELADRWDAEEAMRRLADPEQAAIPYAEARKMLGLDDDDGDGH